MARIRTIKPEFWTDEKVVECSLTARLFFIGMLNFADDKGCLARSPKRLKMQIFPADSIDCESLIQELIVQNLIDEYSVEGVPYLHIRGFNNHQVINKPSSSKIPNPPEFIEQIHEEELPLPENSRSAHTALTEDYGRATGVLPDGKERKGKDLKHKNLKHKKIYIKKISDDDETTTALPEVTETTETTDPPDKPDNAPKPRKKRTHHVLTEFPNDFRPNESHQALAEKLSLDLQSAFEHFRDHCMATGKTFKDWNFGLNTWLRKAPKFDKTPNWRGSARAPPRHDFRIISEPDNTIPKGFRGSTCA